jgi:hypothetical protein
MNPTATTAARDNPLRKPTGVVPSVGQLFNSTHQKKFTHLKEKS